MKRYQFVWWGWKWALTDPFCGFTRLDPNKTDMALIYRWYWWCGPLEIRRWAGVR